MTVEENKAIARRMIEEVYNEGLLDVLDELYDHERFDVGQVRKHVAEWRSAFPGVRFVIEEMVADQTTVAYFWSMHGRHLGDLHFLDAPATGKEVDASGIAILTVTQGKIVAVRGAIDASLLLQLGAKLPR